MPPTADQIAARIAFNLKAKENYNSRPLEQRTRKMTPLQKLNKKSRSKVLARERKFDLDARWVVGWEFENVVSAVLGHAKVS